ncbi:MAG: hypothetical protein ACKN9T_14645 [Candidatus Methylumidiphilus sp.]
MLSAAQNSARIITDMNVKEHFRQTLAAAMADQNVEAEEETAYYLVNVLTHFSRTENLFAATPDGPMIPPLALLYAQAAVTQDMAVRQDLLRRLGDTALLIGGIFSGSLSRKAVDVDYYIGMGGSAFSYLSDMAEGAWRLRALRGVYAELSAKFQLFVDVLDAVGERSQLTSPQDTLRVYDLWTKTGSPRAAAKLRKLGIEPIANPRFARHN